MICVTKFSVLKKNSNFFFLSVYGGIGWRRYPYKNGNNITLGKAVKEKKCYSSNSILKIDWFCGSDPAGKTVLHYSCKTFDEELSRGWKWYILNKNEAEFLTLFIK